MVHYQRPKKKYIYIVFTSILGEIFVTNVALNENLSTNMDEYYYKSILNAAF